MRLFSLLIATMLLFAVPTFAKTVGGVNVPDSHTVNGTKMTLNGAGIRSKFFVKAYVGALYAPQKISDDATALNLAIPKAIRLHIIHDPIPAEKIKGAFEEGITSNSPNVLRTPMYASFMKLFQTDLHTGDILEFQFLQGGNLRVLMNNTTLGEFSSPALCTAVLSIYFGKDPISGLREGMLGL